MVTQYIDFGKDRGRLDSPISTAINKAVGGLPVDYEQKPNPLPRARAALDAYYGATSDFSPDQQILIEATGGGFGNFFTPRTKSEVDSYLSGIYGPQGSRLDELGGQISLGRNYGDTARENLRQNLLGFQDQSLKPISALLGGMPVNPVNPVSGGRYVPFNLTSGAQAEAGTDLDVYDYIRNSQGDFRELTDPQERRDLAVLAGKYAEESKKRGGFGGNLIKGGVLGAIGLGGTLGLGGALGGLGGMTGVSAGGATAGAGGSGGLGSFLGSVLTKPVIMGGLQGAAIPLLTGGDISDALKGALIGGTLGGVGDYVMGGGRLPGLGTLGRGGSISNGIPIPGVKPSGVLGAIGKNTSGLLPTTIGGSQMNLGSLLRGGSDLYSAYRAKQAQDEAKDLLLRQTDAQLAALNPFINAGRDAQERLQEAIASGEIGGEFTPGDLTQDPGFQFQLQQGEEALGRAQSARGNLYSGAALKAAQRFGQGLAEQTYQDAYNRDLARQQNLLRALSGQAGTGLSAAGGIADIYGNIGNIQAQTALGREEINQRLLSNILGGTRFGGIF